MWIALGLVVFAVALRALPVAGQDITLSPAEVGLMRRGRRDAVRQTKAALEADGFVERHAEDGVRRTDRPLDRRIHPLGRAVCSALVNGYGHDAMRYQKVARALDMTRGRLAANGLWPGPGRWLLSRTAVLAALVLTVIDMFSGPHGAGAYVARGSVLLLAALLWFRPRCTIGGWRTLRAVRRGALAPKLVDQEYRVPRESHGGWFGGADAGAAWGGGGGFGGGFGWGGDWVVAPMAVTVAAVVAVAGTATSAMS